MRPSSTQTKPFDQGALSVKTGGDAVNPYAEGSIEFGNYELGRAYALRAQPSLGARGVAAAQATSAGR